MKRKLIAALIPMLVLGLAYRRPLAQKRPPKPNLNPLAAAAGTTATTGQVLTWNGSAWVAGGVPPLIMTGDVTGTTSASTVAGLRGRAISTASPATGQTLTFDGTQWAPVTPAAGGPGGTVNMSGDVTGTNAVSSVVALRGKPIGTATPMAGQLLSFDGTNWSPSAPVNAVMTGDVNGNVSGNTVSSLQGHTLTTAGVTTGQILSFNGSSWVPASPAGGVQGVLAAGTITVSGATNATHNFPTPLPAGAICQVQPQFDPTSLPSLTWWTTTSTTSVTVNLSTAGSGTFNFMCSAAFN